MPHAHNQSQKNISQENIVLWFALFVCFKRSKAKFDKCQSSIIWIIIFNGFFGFWKLLALILFYLFALEYSFLFGSFWKEKQQKGNLVWIFFRLCQIKRTQINIDWLWTLFTAMWVQFLFVMGKKIALHKFIKFYSQNFENKQTKNCSLLALNNVLVWTEAEEKENIQCKWLVPWLDEKCSAAFSFFFFL